MAPPMAIIWMSVLQRTTQIFLFVRLFLIEIYNHLSHDRSSLEPSMITIRFVAAIARFQLMTLSFRKCAESARSPEGIRLVVTGLCSAKKGGMPAPQSSRK